MKLPFSQLEHVQIFPLPSPSKICALFFHLAFWRTLKNIFYYQRDVENYTNQVLNFLFFDRHVYIHTEFPVCNSGQHTYVTGLFNFFFVLQDWLTESIPISREQLFRGTCFLLASNIRVSQVFSDVNKQPSLEWNLQPSLKRRNYGGKWPMSIKYQNLHSFKERSIL